MSQPKEIRLTPSHQSRFWWYLVGVLLVPLFGFGLIIIFRTYRKLKHVGYIVTERTIETRDTKLSEKADLANIKSVKVRQRWIDKQFDIGDLLLNTNSRTLTLKGQKNPGELAKMIEQAVRNERERIESLKKKPEPVKIQKPGRDDRIDYLTGLWQQGLLSDEDFKKEKKHFE